MNTPAPAPGPSDMVSGALVLLGGALLAAAAAMVSPSLGAIVAGAELLIVGLWWRQ